MKPKDTVFGSKAERAVYSAIKSEWAWRFNLYLSLPFPMVIDITGAQLSYSESELIFKTSLDFTLTNKANDRPVLSVEFDGLGSGFSCDGVYHQARDTSDTDPHRKLKLDLKLKLAEQAGYPLIVIGYEETKQIDKAECLTVLDGVIGQVLAAKWFASQGRQLIARLNKECTTLNDAENHERMQESVWDAELLTKLLWNPVFQRAADFAEEVVKTGLVTSWRHEYLSRRFGPPAPATVKVRVSTDVQGISMSETIVLRNANVGRIDVMEIAQSIARYRLFARVLKLAGLPLPPDSKGELRAALPDPNTPALDSNCRLG
jgi:hypothetical protein